MTEEELDILDSINAAGDLQESRAMNGNHMTSLVKSSATVGKKVTYVYSTGGGEDAVIIEDL